MRSFKIDLFHFYFIIFLCFVHIYGALSPYFMHHRTFHWNVFEHENKCECGWLTKTSFCLSYSLTICPRKLYPYKICMTMLFKFMPADLLSLISCTNRIQFVLSSHYQHVPYSIGIVTLL